MCFFFFFFFLQNLTLNSSHGKMFSFLLLFLCFCMQKTSFFFLKETSIVVCVFILQKMKSRKVKCNLQENTQKRQQENTLKIIYLTRFVGIIGFVYENILNVFHFVYKILYFFI